MSNVVKFKTRREMFIENCTLSELHEDDFFEYGLLYNDIDWLINNDYMYYSHEKDVYVWQE